MTERYSVHAAGDGRQLRPSKFSNPAAALAYGYAWAAQQTERCPKHGPGRRHRASVAVPWCGCFDFVVRDEDGSPVPGRRCIALALGMSLVISS